MPLVLKTILALLGITSILPLLGWAMTGNLRAGLKLWGQWWLLMGALAIPGLAVAGIQYLWRFTLG